MNVFFSEDFECLDACSIFILQLVFVNYNILLLSFPIRVAPFNCEKSLFPSQTHLKRLFSKNYDVMLKHQSNSISNNPIGTKYSFSYEIFGYHFVSNWHISRRAHQHRSQGLILIAIQECFMFIICILIGNYGHTFFALVFICMFVECYEHLMSTDATHHTFVNLNNPVRSHTTRKLNGLAH